MTAGPVSEANVELVRRAQVLTIAGGKMTRMEMYADAAAALRAVRSGEPT